MKFRSKRWFVIFLCLVFFTTGCLFIKLWRVKNQAANFDENFKIANNKELSLIFLKPLLNKKDITSFMAAEPTTKQSEIKWVYQLEKRYSDAISERKKFDIALKLEFENEKLKVVVFPKRFIQYIPKTMLRKFIQAFGEGQVKKRDRELRSRYKIEDKSEIFSTNKILALLGKPYSVAVKSNEKTFIYRYKIVSPYADHNNKVGVKLNYNFNLETGFLKSLTANIKGFGIIMEFIEVRDANIPK